eukprot:SAG31_NODE_1453_length_8285_cov_11.761544_1_plen_500_part_00
MKLSVKVRAGATGDYHRFNLSGNPGFDFKLLRQKVATIAQETFGVPDGPDVSYKITYLDDENDACVLATQEDLETAISFLPNSTAPLRLTVEQCEPAAAQQSIPATGREHTPRWHAVRSGAGWWHSWATSKFGPMPARRLAAAWSIGHAEAVRKIIAAMEGCEDTLAAIEQALGPVATAGGQAQPSQNGDGDDWHFEPWLRHCMMMKGAMKGKGGWKGKGCWKGKEKGRHRHHGVMKGKGGRSEADWGHCRGRSGGPAHQLAEALGIDKHEAWHLIELAASGDSAAKEKIAAAFPDKDQANKMDAAWLEAKLAKKADKMANKSESLEQKAAWFAASCKKKHLAKAAKLQQKAAAVQSKGEHFQSLAAGLRAKAIATDEVEPAPAPEFAPGVDDNTTDQGDAGFVETFTIVDPPTTGTNVDPTTSPAIEVASEGNGDAAVADGMIVDVPTIPPQSKWAAAMETMTTNMGFEPALAAQALQDQNGNVQLAVSQLIGSIPPV